MAVRFLDTNVLLRHLTYDDFPRAARSQALLERIERGDEVVAVTSLTVFETIFTLRSKYARSRQEIRDLVSVIVEIETIVVPERETHLAALDIYAEHGIAYADAFNVAAMRAAGATEIYSWDRDYRKVSGIVPVEPPAAETA